MEKDSKRKVSTAPEASNSFVSIVFAPIGNSFFLQEMTTRNMQKKVAERTMPFRHINEVLIFILYKNFRFNYFVQKLRDSLHLVFFCYKIQFLTFRCIKNRPKFRS